MVRNILFVNFTAFCILGFCVFLAQKIGVSLPLLINNYLNDFLIIPIVLTVCLYVLQFTRSEKAYKIPLFIILFLCVAYAIFFEVFIPKIKARYTADIVDVFVYFLGGLWFWFLQKISL